MHTVCLSPFRLLQQDTTHWVASKKKFISYSLEAGSPRSEHRHSPVRAHIGVTAFLLCPHMAEGAEDLSGASFIRALTPFMWAPP